MRRWRGLTLLAIVLGVGCRQPANEAPLQPGDTVRPQIAYAPEAPWQEGMKVTLGLLLQVQRPGRAEAVFLRDEDVSPERAAMCATVTFYREGVRLGEPLEVPFVRDC